MSWVFLGLAILLEVTGTSFMKASQGLSKILPAVLMFGCYAGSLSFLSFALKQIDLGIAYAIWAGLGTAIVAVIGTAFFGETMNLLKAVSLVLIIAGVVGLNIAK
jgi:small multidrug resistance pump